MSARSGGARAAALPRTRRGAASALCAAWLLASLEADAEPTNRIEVGPYAGIAVRPSESGSISYSPGLLLGGRARAFVCECLRISVSVDFDDHAVEGPALGISSPSETHPDLAVYRLAASIDPTWQVTPRFLVWASVGGAWARSVAPFYEPAGFRVPRRTGVVVELPLGLGASFEVVPNWVTVGAWGAFGIPLEQSGSLFQRSQVIDEGRVSSVDGLPKFGGSLLAAAAVTVIL